MNTNDLVTNLVYIVGQNAPLQVCLSNWQMQTALFMNGLEMGFWPAFGWAIFLAVRRAVKAPKFPNDD
jgi:hypothetical protein